MKGDDSMRIETTYYADDDTEFETEEECREYEEHLAQDLKSVTFLDQDLKRMDSPSLEDIESYAFYLYIRDGEKVEDAIAWLTEQCSFDTDGLDYPLVAGDIYRFNGDNGKWVDMRQELENIQSDIDTIVKAVTE